MLLLVTTAPSAVWAKWRSALGCVHFTVPTQQDDTLLCAVRLKPDEHADPCHDIMHNGGTSLTE